MLYTKFKLLLKCRFVLLLFLAAGLAGVVPLLQAQTTASLSGNVVDATGAVIPGAKVTLTNNASGDKHDVTSNSSGYFTFAGVIPGTYTVDIAAPGFRGFRQDDVAVNPADVRSLGNLSLTIGGANDTVTVQSSANEIAPQDSGERSALLSAKDIETLRQGSFSNLKNYHYYINVKLDGEDFKPQEVTDFTAQFKGLNLEYNFTIDLPHPAKKMELSLYDPEFYVDIGPPIQPMSPDHPGIMSETTMKPKDFISTSADAGAKAPTCSWKQGQPRVSASWGKFAVFVVNCEAAQ